MGGFCTFCTSFYNFENEIFGGMKILHYLCNEENKV